MSHGNKACITDTIDGIKYEHYPSDEYFDDEFTLFPSFQRDTMASVKEASRKLHDKYGSQVSIKIQWT